MISEIGPSNYESIGQVSSSQEGQEGRNKVTQADIARVAEAAKKAKQIQGQIAQSKRNNNVIAQFLTHIMQTIKYDEIITQIYKVFFTKIDSNTGSKQLPSILHGLIVCALFVPYMQQKAKDFGLMQVFSSYLREEQPTISSYISFQNTVLQVYKMNFFSSDLGYVNLLIMIMDYFGTVDYKSFLPEKKKEFVDFVFQQLQK